MQPEQLLPYVASSSWRWCAEVHQSAISAARCTCSPAVQDRSTHTSMAWCTVTHSYIPPQHYLVGATVLRCTNVILPSPQRAQHCVIANVHDNYDEIVVLVSSCLRCLKHGWRPWCVLVLLLGWTCFTKRQYMEHFRVILKLISRRCTAIKLQQAHEDGDPLSQTWGFVQFHL